MKHRKVEKKSPQTTSTIKQKTTSNKTKTNQNDLKSQPQSFSTILLITILLAILFGVVVLYQSMSTPDNNNETQFIRDPLKMEKRAEKSGETSNTSERDINTESDGKITKSKESVSSANQEKDGDVTKTKSANKEKTSIEKSKTEKRVPTQIEEEMKKFKSTIQNHISPKKIFADGRRLPPTELLPQKPNNSSVRVFLYDEFLSTEECDGLMKAHNRHVTDLSKKDPIICFDSIETLRKHLKAARIKKKVSPLDFTDGTTCLNSSFSSQFKQWIHSNWSYSTAFYPGESRFSKVFEYRIKEAIELDPKNGGKFQITSYPLNVGYKTHTDCIENNQDERDRVATILVYLQDVEEGGETQFPELGIWVKPRKGRALVWNNMNKEGKCEHLSIHQAAKVTKGHKFILQRWYYYKSFYSLGKRPPEPHIPVMEPGTPRVSCDEYEHGSCRWYDEWNYDHIIEYQNQKITLI